MEREHENGYSLPDSLCEDGTPMYAVHDANRLLRGVTIMRKAMVFLLLMALAVRASAGSSVTEIDFLEKSGLEFNGAGPLLVQVDEARNRLVTVNTLSSSVSVIDCATGEVVNIPIAGRAFQHLKSESLTIGEATGRIYLIGRNCFYIVDPEQRSSRQIPTDAQFESIAVDETSGNVFIAGRESRRLGFYQASSGKLRMLDWLETEETLINLNATPPPPIRKVVADGSLGRIVAVDGLDPAVYTFDGTSGRLRASRPIGLSPDGRWHLGGYNETSHHLYLVVETADRKVIEAARIDATGNEDLIVPLPEYTEGVGVTYNSRREEVYIPYDNHPSVHVVDFGNGGELHEIMLPAYGNDGSAVDAESDTLYIASWAYGEIDVIDLRERKLVRRYPGLGIIPHMFALAFNPNTGLVYFPKGASAVNGTFGSAVSAFDPSTGEVNKIYTGWAPIDLIEVESRGSFLVFNSEDTFAEVTADGSCDMHRLPFDYPIRAVDSPEGDVYLSYGPHQSYWPTVYIWDAKNGVLTIDADDLGLYDRRIPRQAHEMVVDRGGKLYFTQNNWGREEQFVGVLKDQVRLFDANQRLRLVDEVEREITQRILRYDEARHLLYLVRVGERDEDPSVLQVIEPDTGRILHRVEVGKTATDLAFDSETIYVVNFDSKSVSLIDKDDFSVSVVEAGEQPLKLCACAGGVYAIDHAANRLIEVGGTSWELPTEGSPDNIFEWNGSLVITSHSHDRLHITSFDPGSGEFAVLHTLEYPYGDTRFDSRNVSFYLGGQFGDALFSITRGKTDSSGRLWISDFLSGKVFILSGSR
jgi:DNA-binding beta-propeller fold protein YncE